MSSTIFKSEEAQHRMADWYQRFLHRADIETTSIEVTTSYGVNHLLTAGDPSKTPLVCLHSMLTSSAHLLSEIASLAESFYLILPDMPGQSVKGLPLRLSYKDNSHAKWLREILDALNLERAHFLGVSLGGFVARQFASAWPDRVQTLTLLVAAGIVQGSVVLGLAKMAGPMILYKIQPNEKRLRKVVDPLLTTWDTDWANYLADTFNDFKPNYKIPPLASDHELQKLSMPVLFIVAEKDISFPGLQMIQRVEGLVPFAQTELLKDSKHSPPTTPEFRQWLRSRVKKFVNTIQPVS